MAIEPGPDPELHQRIVDEEHLGLLAIGYYVSAGICAFFSLFGLLYAGFGVVLATLAHRLPAGGGAGAPPAVLGWIFAGLGLAAFLVLLVLAYLKFRAGRCLKRHHGRTFCMVMAAISCFEIPYGALLGVFTFIVLDRASVKRLFDRPEGSATDA
jgi:hypothetical protein